MLSQAGELQVASRQRCTARPPAQFASVEVMASGPATTRSLSFPTMTEAGRISATSLEHRDHKKKNISRDQTALLLPSAVWRSHNGWNLRRSQWQRNWPTLVMPSFVIQRRHV